MKLDELFYSLGDVAAGKRTLEDVCKDMVKQDKKKFEDLFDYGKKILKKLKENVKQSARDEIKNNDMQAKYDMSQAISAQVDGKTMFVGLKPKEKQSWWRKWRTNASQSLQNAADVVGGKKSVTQGLKDEVSRVNQSILNESSVYRKGYSAVKGGINGVKKTFNELRGIESENKPVPKNPYQALDMSQFRAAMGAAYENLVKMEHLGAMPDSEKAKGIAEIQKIIEAAKDRFPNVMAESKGAYFQNAKLQETEAVLFAYMKEDAQKSGDAVAQGDVARYASWREGKDFEIKGGMMTIQEMPFENVARYGSASWRNDEKRDDYTARDYLKNPLQSAKNTLSTEQIALEKAKLEKLVIR